MRPITMHYYIESDGRLYLISRDGLLDLPLREEIPFSFTRIAPLAIEPETWYCVPELPQHPHDWMLKDEVSGRNDVAPHVRRAVHASMPRAVVEAICLRGREVLLVKGSRGFNKDRWSLPGGFLQYGETPERGVIREISEELRVRSSIVRFLSAESKLGAESKLHWLMLFYQVELDEEPNPDPDEIIEARYFGAPEAAAKLHDPIMARTVLACASDESATAAPC